MRLCEMQKGELQRPAPGKRASAQRSASSSQTPAFSHSGGEKNHHKVEPFCPHFWAHCTNCSGPSTTCIHSYLSRQ